MCTLSTVLEWMNLVTFQKWLWQCECWKCHNGLPHHPICQAFLSLFQSEPLLFISIVYSKATPKTALMCNLPRHIPFMSHLCEISYSYLSVFLCYKYWQMECTIASKNQQLVNLLYLPEGWAVRSIHAHRTDLSQHFDFADRGTWDAEYVWVCLWLPNVSHTVRP